MQTIPQSFEVEIAAFEMVNDKENLIIFDRQHINNIEPDEEKEVDFFIDGVLMEDQEKLKTATFRVINVESLFKFDEIH